jgi:hypothetical protein
MIILGGGLLLVALFEMSRRKVNHEQFRLLEGAVKGSNNVPRPMHLEKVYAVDVTLHEFVYSICVKRSRIVSRQTNLKKITFGVFLKASFYVDQAQL